jgi:hypothetical protein
VEAVVKTVKFLFDLQAIDRCTVRTVLMEKNIWHHGLHEALYEKTGEMTLKNN